MAKIKRHKSLKKGIIATAIIVLAGASSIGLAQGFYQKKCAEDNQNRSNNLVLNEMKDYLNTGENTAIQTAFDFDSNNQDSILTIEDELYDNNYFSALYDSEQNLVHETQMKINAKLKEIAEFSNIDRLFLADETGYIISSNESFYMDASLDTFFDEYDESSLLIHYSDENCYINGTFRMDSENNIFYTPVIQQDEFESSYSCFLDGSSINFHDLYLIRMSDNTTYLETIDKLINVEYVINALQPGKNGFVVAIDTYYETFSYFENDELSYTGESYKDLGLSDKAILDGYSGYQTIGGKRYFVTTRDVQQTSYSEGIYIMSLTRDSDLLSGISSTIVLSLTGFIGLFIITFVYAVIVRHDNQKHLIWVKKKKQKEVMDADDNITPAQANEASKEYVISMINEGEDIHTKGIHVGKRNYLSTRSIQQSTPIVLAGVAIIFIASFFTQTLLSIKDVSEVSSARLSDAVDILKQNEEKTDKAVDNVNEQYLQRDFTLSYTLTSNSNYILSFNTSSDKCHQLYYYDKDGNKQTLTDTYGHTRYANERSTFLSGLCTSYSLNEVTVFDDVGYVLATSHKDWFQALEDDTTSSTYHFREVIDNKRDYYVPDIELDDDEITQSIGVPFYYFTVDYSGTTKYLTRKQASETTDPYIKHRGLCKITFDKTAFASILASTNLNNILDNIKVYSEDSFCLAFDTTEQHNVVYAPISSYIGRSADSINIPSSMFTATSVASEFLKIDGNRYYVSAKLVNDLYIFSAVSETSMNAARIPASLIAIGITLFLLVIGVCYYSLFNKDVLIAKVLALEPTYKMNNEEKIIKYPDIKILGKKFETPNKKHYQKHTKWQEMTAGEKLTQLIFGYFVIISIMILVAYFATIRSNNENGLFSYLFLGKWNKGINLFSVTTCLMVMTVVFSLSKLIILLMKRFSDLFSNKTKTVSLLIASTIRVVAIMIGVFYSLYIFGFNTSSILASAGILSVVVGIGAQKVVGDILSGIIIVFENTYQVGDFVQLGDFRGQVIDVGLRTTKIKGKGQNIMIVNNSSVNGILNLSKMQSMALVTATIDYTEDINRVEEILKKELPLLMKKNSNLLSVPECLGVSQMQDSAIGLLIMAKCNEEVRPSVERFLNREVFDIFVRNNINVPFNQLTLSFRENEKITLKSEDDVSKVEQIIEVNDLPELNKNEKLILDLIKKDSLNTNVDALVSATGLSRSTVIRTINSLIEKELIVRVGAKKDGHWESK